MNTNSFNSMTQICTSSLIPKKEIGQIKIRDKSPSHQSYNELNSQKAKSSLCLNHQPLLRAGLVLYGNQAKLRRSRFPLSWKLISERSLNVLIKIHPLATKLSNTLNHLLSRRQKISPVPREMVGGQSLESIKTCRNN
jgi:hypothetical protein